jgi:hypothetical protein
MQASLAAGRLLRCCLPFTHVLLPCYRSVLRAAYRARQPALGFVWFKKNLQIFSDFSSYRIVDTCMKH